MLLLETPLRAGTGLRTDFQCISIPSPSLSQIICTHDTPQGVACSEVNWPRDSSSVASQDVLLCSSRVENTNDLFAMLLLPARTMSCVRTWVQAKAATLNVMWPRCLLPRRRPPPPLATGANVTSAPFVASRVAYSMFRTRVPRRGKKPAATLSWLGSIHFVGASHGHNRSLLELRRGPQSRIAGHLGRIS